MTLHSLGDRGHDEGQATSCGFASGRVRCRRRHVHVDRDGARRIRPAASSARVNRPALRGLSPPGKLAVMATPTEIVVAFCGAWEDVDLDALALFFADDAVYHNMPMDPIVGRDAIMQAIAGFTAGSDGIEFEIVNISANGPIVLTERIDRFFRPDRTVVLPVMGAFEIADGRITAWRDYFDLNQYLQQVS